MNDFANNEVTHFLLNWTTDIPEWDFEPGHWRNVCNEELLHKRILTCRGPPAVFYVIFKEQRPPVSSILVRELGITQKATLHSTVTVLSIIHKKTEKKSHNPISFINIGAEILKNTINKPNPSIFRKGMHFDWGKFISLI